jgi:hypothetical protein
VLTYRSLGRPEFRRRNWRIQGGGTDGPALATPQLGALTMTVSTSLLGKRYRCAICGTELLCVKPGSAPFVCHAEPMTLLEPKQLPVSD